MSTKRCSLCNAVAELLPSGIRLRICSTMDQKETRLQVYLAATSSRHVVSRAPWSFRVGVWSCDPCRRLSGIIGDDWSRSTGHYSHLDYTGNYRHFGLLRVRINTPLKTPISSGPPPDLSIVDLPDLCDVRFVERAMSRCVNEHSELCSIPRHTDLNDDNNQHNQPDGLRTIDVVTMQLVDHPPNTQYVALSYNWDHSGGGHFDFTSTSNIEYLRAPRGLLSIKLPQTVTDAIYVCQQSNFRYLWVDSICIIQDSYEDKAQQISRMDHVYGAASVAIVVACGMDPSKGITTLRELSPRQIKVSVGEVELITTEVPLENALRNSLWNTRGWTFQELMLPRRLIVFTSSQAYFVCAKGIIAEDTVDGHAYDTVYDDKIKRDPFAIWTMLSTAGRSSQQRTNWDVYRHAVTSYTHRTLTFASDRLAAISGVLGALGNFTKDTFVCGLPAKLFPGALIWYSTGASSRCVEFPSWSWAGWLGELTYPGRSELPLGPIASGGRVERVASHLKEIRFCSNDGVRFQSSSI